MSTLPVLSMPEAEALVESALTAIGWDESHGMRSQYATPESNAADRERLASDLAGLRKHQPRTPQQCGGCLRYTAPCDDARRYSDNLRRTASLYRATP